MQEGGEGGCVIYVCRGGEGAFLVHVELCVGIVTLLAAGWGGGKL